MINAIQPVLSQILSDHPPNSVLSIGREVGAALKTFVSRHPHRRVLQIDLASKHVSAVLELLDCIGIFDFGIAANTIEFLEKHVAIHVLARLRDLHTKKLLIVAPIGEQWKNHCSYWEETDLVALGFIVKAKIMVEQKPVHIYTFDIASYKTTPDWLNNKYWANPELWDKYWW